MADVFEAVCFAAAAPGSRPCRVRVEPGHLAIEMEGEAGPAVRWPYERIDCAPGGEEQGWLMVACPEAADDRVSRLVAREPALLAALAERVPEPCRAAIAGFHGHRRGHALRRRGGLVAFAIGAALVAACGWPLLTRVLPGVVARSLPPATEAALGRALVQQLLDDGEPIEAGPAVDAVRAITERLVAAVEPATGHAFEVHVLRDPLVNALALPGGQIVVYTGLLAEAGSADEVAGVLAHEIQHVLHRDALRRLVGQLGGWALIGLVTGGGDLGAIAAHAGDLVQLSYGRDQEREADRDGLRLLARAGLPPAAMPAFFERLGRREGGGLPEWLSTHPDTARRIGELRALVVDTPVAAPRPLEIDWQAVQASLE